MDLQVKDLPEALTPQARGAWEQILERAGEALASRLNRALAGSPAAAQLPRVLACSPFVADLCRRRPGLLLSLLEGGELQRTLPEADFRGDLQRRLKEPGAELGVVLRRYRQWHMLRIVWRDFCRLEDTTLA